MPVVLVETVVMSRLWGRRRTTNVELAPTHCQCWSRFFLNLVMSFTSNTYVKSENFVASKIHLQQTIFTFDFLCFRRPTWNLTIGMPLIFDHSIQFTSFSDIFQCPNSRNKLFLRNFSGKRSKCHFSGGWVDVLIWRLVLMSLMVDVFCAVLLLFSTSLMSAMWMCVEGLLSVVKRCWSVMWSV